jgi:hypothetical protein
MLPISKLDSKLLRILHGSIVPGTSMIGKLSKYALGASPTWDEEHIYFGEDRNTREMPVGMK